VAPGWVASLRSAVRGTVVDDGSALAAASRDASPVEGRAEAVVRPLDRDDVVSLVQWARRTKVPLTGRGGGTSLDGESVPVQGGVVVDFAGWTSVGPVDRAGRRVSVGVGVVNRDLHDALRRHGLFFPPNPGSWRSSTIGGNVSTNASGPRSFRYGPTRSWVAAVELVLGTGELVRVGPGTLKRSVGPDLLDLAVGAEGTLGLLTSVTLRLATAPARRCGIAVAVPEHARLGAIASSIAAGAPRGLSALEYVDGTVAEALRGRPGARLPGPGALLLLEVESDGEAEESTALATLAETMEASGVREAPSVLPDSDRMWNLRGEAGGVLEGRTGPSVREDIAVPLDRVDALLDRIAEIAKAEGVPAYVYGHLGQGNLHPTIATDPRNEPGRRVRASLLAAARALGGTVSGEHGVGALKRDRVAEELGEVPLRLLRGWKAACDPDGILNPGKLLP
jgi:FAD/FMN-containing dehydrogenase